MLASGEHTAVPLAVGVDAMPIVVTAADDLTTRRTVVRGIRSNGTHAA